MLERYKDVFTEKRWSELCQLVKQKGMRISFRDFTVSELKLIIDETVLSETVKKGAILYYIERVKQNQISSRLGYSDSAVHYHRVKVSKALRTTCCRIFK